MELNHEYQNMYIRGIIHAINQAVEMGSISTVDFEDIVYDTAHDPRHLIGREFLEAVMQSELFDHSKKYRLKPVLPVKIVLPPTFAELQWLRHALKSPLAALFMDEPERRKLSCLLEQLELPDIMKHMDTFGHAEPQMPDISMFRTVLNAIREHRYLRITNHAENGDIYADRTVMPMKLEYEAASGRWFLSFCEPDAARPIKASLSALSDVQQGDVIPEQLRPDLKELMQAKKQEPILMRVSPERNTPNRAIRFFAQYDTIAEQQPDGGLLMQIRYYRFDTERLLRQIISFGPFVQVLAPEPIVERMREYLKKLPY